MGTQAYCENNPNTKIQITKNNKQLIPENKIRIKLCRLCDKKCSYRKS